MRIGIISDSHGAYDDFKKAVEILEDVDKIIHLGDVLYHGPRNDLPKGYNPKKLASEIKGLDKFIYIKGNCDSEVDEMVIEEDLEQKERVIEIDGVKWYMTHGHKKTEEYLIKRAEQLGAKVILTGHTHVKRLERRHDLIFLNPGSISIPKDGLKSLAVYEDKIFSLLSLENGDIISSISL